MHKLFFACILIRNLVFLFADVLLFRFFLRSEKDKKPRLIFTEACAEIAEPFEDDGFKFVKSQSLIYRKTGQYRQEISFSSSRYNQRGAMVQLFVNVAVFGNEGKKGPDGNRDLLESRDIGDLCQPQTEFYWNLAFISRRKRIISKVQRLIRRRCLPFFETECAPTRAEDLSHSLHNPPARGG